MGALLARTFIVIMGADQDPAGPCLGLRSFIELLGEQTGSSVTFRAHDESGLIEKIAKIPGKIVLIGHSFGGYEALNVLAAMQRLNRTADILCLLDPKPKPLLQWINLLFEFPIPANATIMKCFWGGFGRPFRDKQFSQYVKLRHDRFPADPTIHAWIADAVRSLDT